MKKLRLNQENLDAIQAVINEAEGRATTRCLDAAELLRVVKKWEINVFSPPKSVLRGVQLKVQASADKVAKAYKFIPYETVAYLERDTVGWYVASVVREGVKAHSWNVTATPTDTFNGYVLGKSLIL